jgi:RNA polymerase sigma factor (sigma-70 family)
MLDVGALYDEHEDAVRRYFCYRAARCGLTADDVDDLVADVFERAVRAAPRYRDTGAPVLAWLYRIAHNRLLDWLDRIERRSVDHDAEPEGILIAPDLDEMADLDAALWTLTAKQRAVVAWRYGRDQEWETIGSATGLGYEAAKKLHQRALATLRRRLGVA